MPLVRGIRLLNSLETGNVSGACLETIVSCPARAADFVSILQSPGFACLAASSNTSTHAVTRSNTAMNTMAQTTVGACIYYTTPAFANNFAQSGPAFDNILTSNDSFKHFSNSALTMNCAFATGSQFITCAASSNTNLARMFTCPITTCCIFGSASAMASLANNANIVSYLFNDATAAACFSLYGGATAVCNAFNGPEYINYILQPGKTCAAFACSAIGPYAFTNALSANCFIKNACALCVLVNLPACCALGTSCTFTCFAASTFGIPCATTEYLAGNTSFITQVFALNSCAQLGGLVAKNPFISAYYKSTTPFNDKFNCFWQNCFNTTCGGRACCIVRQDLSTSFGCLVCTSMYCQADVGSSFGVRTPCMECFMTSGEAFYYDCAFCNMYGALSSSNNGNFMVLGGGYQGTSKSTYPMCICVDGVNYCTTLTGAPTHTDAKVSGFCVCCSAMLYSNNNGCCWTRMPGYCIPNTFFTCLCCDGFAYNACTASQCGRVEIQWGLGSFTCCNGIWTGFRINNLCCKNHAIFGYACTCLLANNTPGDWTVCMKPHPFIHLSWCCGYFSGIGGECDFNNFSVATCSGLGCCGCYQHTPSCCRYCGSYRPRFIMGKLTGSQPSVGFMLSSCSNCSIFPETCYQLCHGICGVYFENGCQECKNCEMPVSNPFTCSLDCFFHAGDMMYRGLNPTITFMTCVHANTENMRTYMVQIAKSSGASPNCEEISMRSTCTVLQWNCGNVCCCALKTTILGTSNCGCAPLGGAVALGNTILWMTTPYIVNVGGGYSWHSYNCDQQNIKPFYTTCSQFVWGGSVTAAPDGYTQAGKPFTPCLNCTTWATQFCCATCTNAQRCGFIIRVDYTSNTFFAINCTGCVPSSGHMMYYNHPNAGNTAQEIYGCCDCPSPQIATGAAGAFCNIGTTLDVNRGTAPWGTTGVCFPSAINRSGSEGHIPGCPMQAFCESFMLVQQSCSGDRFDVRGWPCAIVYAGSCCWNWGSTPCTPCAGTPAVTPAMVCQDITGGRCGFKGASFGWMNMCPDPSFNIIGAFGGGCCCNACGYPRFVCTANGMPSVVAGVMFCGTGFYANGQTFSTCVFKLRFVDMF